MNELQAWHMEQHYPKLLFTESDDKTVMYATASDDDRIGIIVKERGEPQRVLLLTEKQARAIAEELPELLWTIGRGRHQNKRGRKSGISV